MSRARQVSQLIGASNTHLVSTPATFSNTVTVAASGITFNDSTVQLTAPSGFGFKNRIINGDMRIDQRNAGASITPTGNAQLLDRWQAYISVTSKFSVQQNAGSVTPPAGFSNYLGVTSLSSYSVGSSDYFYLRQAIEGFNFADMAWGTANAQPVTLSFRVYSSLTGTFGGALSNSASSRSYPFSYSVPVANTWTTVSVTIAGDTTGTWIGATNGVGLQVLFSLGTGTTYSGTAGSWAGSVYVSATGATSVVGTSGATFYITGVQLEKGSTATSFDFRPYGYELQLCQRYFEKSFPINVAPYNPGEGQINGYSIGMATNRSGTGTTIQYAVRKRANPTVTNYGNSSGYWSYQAPNGTITSSANVGPAGGTENGFMFTQQAVDGTAVFVMGHWTANAEL